MKSPFTGGNVSLRQENSELVFRKEKFRYTYLYYECEDTKEHFTTTEIDELNLAQVYNQYRIKYGIPFPDEIKQIREMYDLSALKMSEILGFGDNQYRLYESGGMPSEANGKVLNLIKDPAIFETFVRNARYQLDEKEFKRILAKLNKVIESQLPDIEAELIYDSYTRGSINGYATQSYKKLKNILLYFIERCGGVFNTKMNKLLFYTDFLCYKKYGRAMSGLAYKAIQYGPVPVRWDRVYSLVDGVNQDIVEFESGEEFLLAAKERPFTVLFLDIYMGGANGIEIAKELRKTDADCLLIFTTTSTDHALEGFRVRALHYLVKPYNEKEISTLLDEILSRIPDSGKYIDVKVNGSNIQIPFKNIIYAEHFSHMIHIHTTGGKEMLTRQSFEAFTASLKMDSRFYSCNRGIVINLEHAVDFDGSMFLMDDDNNIPVSRKLLKNARQTFMEFLFQ